MDKDKQILQHIIEYCGYIESTIERFGNDFSVFEKDWDYKSSISFNIQQIGELAKKLSEQFVQKTENDIPWHDIAGMRDLFAHQYASMNLEEIWHTAIMDIPALKEFCKSVI